ncbi:MAG: helix-turn-helix transcriptional regulator, partial [bacterium]|nr:helix-turn-helix transcriptional regulator [bacterium]
RVREIRKDLHFSQRQFAKDLGISGSFLSEIGSGKQEYSTTAKLTRFRFLHIPFQGNTKLFRRTLKPYNIFRTQPQLQSIKFRLETKLNRR